MILILVLAGSVVGSEAEDWACNFVGLRIGRTPSICQEGRCEGIHDAFGPTIITCDYATRLVREILEEIPKPESKVDKASILHDLSTEVKQTIEKIIHGGKVDEARNREVFLNIDSKMAKVYLESPAILTAVRESPIHAEIMTWIGEMVTVSQSVPYHVDAGNPNTGVPAYHFVMDLISWFGVPSDVEFPDLIGLRQAAYRKADRYREQRFRLEKRGNENIQILDSECYPELIDLVDEIGEKAKLHQSNIPYERFTQIVSLQEIIRQWNMGLKDAESQLITAYIRNSDLCKNMGSVPSVIKSEIWSAEWHKTVLTLMHICNVAPHKTAWTVRAGYKAEKHRTAHIVRNFSTRFRTSREFVTYMITDWWRALPGLPVHDKSNQAQAGYLADYLAITRVIGTDGAFRSPGTFSNATFTYLQRMRALGQGMGALLVCKEETFSMRFGNILQLRTDLVRAIHTIPDNASEEFLKTIFHIRKGIFDGMGGLGVASFTLHQWEYLFARTP